MIALYLLAAAAVLVLLVSRICFSMAFHVPPSRHLTDEGEVHLPDGSIYVPYHDRMRQWALEKRALPQRHVTITSHDGLKLWASFFEFAPGAPVEIMFHGYRGWWTSAPPPAARAGSSPSASTKAGTARRGWIG